VNRWLRAGAAAILVAMWPACIAHPEDDGGEAGPVEYANLDFTLKDMNGQDVRFADFKGRPLIINFWATWCAPCKHEIPSFIALTEKYREQQLTVLGVSIDDRPEDLVPFAREFGINYPVLVALGREDVLDAYAAGLFVPTSWFIRPDGSVYLKYPGTNTEAWFEEQVRAIIPAAPAADGDR
jgi:thiol-disulfide isomerase/thioredoxin